MQVTTLKKPAEITAAALVIEATDKELPWQDCECGCQGMTVTFGGHQFLRTYCEHNKLFALYRGHRTKTRVAHSLSRQEVNALVIWHLRPLFNRARNEVEAWDDIFA